MITYGAKEYKELSRFKKIRINRDLTLISNELSLHVLCKARKPWHQRKQSFFDMVIKRFLSLLIISMTGLKYSFEPTIDSMSDLITTRSNTGRAGDHQTPSSSQNNPIRDMEAMAIEIHWSLRTRVITLITTSQ